MAIDLRSKGIYTKQNRYLFIPYKINFDLEIFQR